MEMASKIMMSKALCKDEALVCSSRIMDKAQDTQVPEFIMNWVGPRYNNAQILCLTNKP